MTSPLPASATTQGDTNIDGVPGLTTEEAGERLAKEGFNELPASSKRGFLTLIFAVVKEPMFLLLIACGALYVTMGDMGEAILLLCSVFIIIAITFVQERKTERALEALKDFSSPRALVVRDGVVQRIPGREVVRGDIVLLGEGDRVPADGTLLSATNLTVNESLLTGESMTVRKTRWDGVLQITRPGGNDLPFVYSGTLVTGGNGVAHILTTGVLTEIGKIGRSLQILIPEQSLLQKEVRSVVKKFAFVGLFLCAIVFLLYGATYGEWRRAALSGLALAISLLPEEFPVILSVFLALGAWRLSLKQVLARNIPVIETLGATTALCTDKTGTLTINQMTIEAVAAGDAEWKPNFQTELSEKLREVVEYAMLASRKNPFDPMEQAVVRLGEHELGGSGRLHPTWNMVKQYPLSAGLLSMSQAWASPETKGCVIAAKGAPEAIAGLCRMTPSQDQSLRRDIERMASDGLRVIAVAKAHFVPDALPNDQRDFDFVFLGLLGFADPVRKEAKEAIAECIGAGIRPIMITGDYPGTAKNIAREIGLPSPEMITGEELEAMTDGELEIRAKHTTVYARVVPEQKLRIVQALKKNGEIVAMTGDGVNDAPALKAAHVGIAMGKRGTDVAREASALVLVNDDFESIVRSIRSGRRIFTNISKAITFAFAAHIPVAGATLLPILFRWPLILFPAHIVFLELIVDPACSVVFEAEPEEKDVMKKKPRKMTERLFGAKMLSRATIQGLSVLLVVLSAYWTALQHMSVQEARAVAFIVMVAGNIGLILVNRSRSILSSIEVKNGPFLILAGGIISLLFLVFSIPTLRYLFAFEQPATTDIILAVVAGLFSVAWLEVLKIFGHKKKHR